MERLSFNIEEHEYRIDGYRVPSVTGVMRIMGLVSSFSFDDPIHSFRGHAVHHGCALIDQNIQPPPWFVIKDDVISPADPKYSEYVQVASDINHGYLPAYRAFKARTGFQGFCYECVMFHPVLRFGGTFDVIGECGDEIWLVDLKSGVLPELVPVQLSAYEMLIRNGVPLHGDHAGFDWVKQIVLQGERKIRRVAVRLTKDGTDTMFSETSKGTSYDSREFDNSWKAAISLYNMRQSYGFL